MFLHRPECVSMAPNVKVTHADRAAWQAGGLGVEWLTLTHTLSIPTLRMSLLSTFAMETRTFQCRLVCNHPSDCMCSFSRKTQRYAVDTQTCSKTICIEHTVQQPIACQQPINVLYQPKHCILRVLL